MKWMESEVAWNRTLHFHSTCIPIHEIPNV